MCFIFEAFFFGKLHIFLFSRNRNKMILFSFFFFSVCNLILYGNSLEKVVLKRGKHYSTMKRTCMLSMQIELLFVLLFFSFCLVIVKVKEIEG